ncbi:hypothetical protein ScPMuIL_014356 [Solemya velum]
MALHHPVAALLSLVGLLISPVTGAAPVFSGAETAKVASGVADAAMVPGYTVAPGADGDTIDYTVAGAFTVVGAGLVTTNDAVTAAGTYELTATDGTNPTVKTINYDVFTDAADPAISGDLTAKVAKDAASGTTVTTSYTVTDTDTTNGDGFTYELAANTEFEIGLFDGVLKTKATLGDGPYSLALTVKDSKRTNPATANIAVTVKQLPVFGGTGNTAKVAAGHAGAAMIPAYTITDPDDGDTLTYSTQTASFTIDSATGLVTSDASLSSGGTYDLTASDGTATKTQAITFTTFVDANNPTITGDMTAKVANDAPVGTTVTTSYTAADTDADDKLWYELAANSEFEIGLFDGVLKTKAAMGAGPYNLQLTVKDSKRSSATGTIVVSVNHKHVFGGTANTAPVFGGTANTAKVAAGTPNAAMIPAYTVTDAETGDTLVFSTQTANMAVVGATGLVTTDNALNADDTGTYALAVTDGTATVTETITYTVFTNNADPVIGGTLTATVAKSATVGTTVTTSFTVTDADTDNGDGFTYELAANSEFEIGLWDGVLKTKAAMGVGPYNLALTVKDSKRTAATETIVDAGVYLPCCFTEVSAGRTSVPVPHINIPQNGRKCVLNVGVLYAQKKVPNSRIPVNQSSCPHLISQNKNVLSHNFYRALKLELKADTPEDLSNWLHSVGQRQVKKKVTTGNPRRLSIFLGDVTKGEATYDRWRYEIRSLQHEKYRTGDIIEAIRRSKFDSVYGMVVIKETILLKFYGARQGENEDITSWSCRLEDILDRALERGLVTAGETIDMLRSMFWTGLLSDLKDISGHKYDSVKEFDKLRIELRMIEQEEEQGKKSKQIVTESLTDKAGNVPHQMKELIGMMESVSSKVSNMSEQLTELSGIVHHQQQESSNTGGRYHPNSRGQSTYQKR